MSDYEKYTWVTGEIITAEKLNHLEDGIEDAYQKPSGGIPKTDLASTVFITSNEIPEVLNG